MAKLSQAEKEKRKPKFLANLFKGRRAKAKEAASKKGMAESAMKSTVAKAEKKYAKESMFPKARDEQRTKTAKARPFSVAFRSAKDAGKKTFLWKGKSYHTKTKSEMEAGSREKEKFERMAKSKKVPNNQSTFNKFKDSKTLAEFFGKLKKK